MRWTVTSGARASGVKVARVLRPRGSGGRTWSDPRLGGVPLPLHFVSEKPRRRLSVG